MKKKSRKRQEEGNLNINRNKTKTILYKRQFKKQVEMLEIAFFFLLAEKNVC